MHAIIDTLIYQCDITPTLDDDNSHLSCAEGYTMVTQTKHPISGNAPSDNEAASNNFLLQDIYQATKNRGY